ncbi:PP0621 family protein [Pseudothauera lacus]|uniref:Preprotein translocase subunit YajC n=1 Tax=Pseudothauera lacus TaxID=2136175 RepID=A0A2T4ICG5_9RHOO|nr:PP0621 family protein [Pseudothauera lacus]PTD95467.1 hypothetical protein C8261_14715 [Pseudothauera lacus]
MRNILIFILLLIVVWWLRRALQGFRARRAGRPSAEGRRTPAAERMVACAHCGVHVPESEGVREGAEFFCCAAHRRLGARRS